MTDAGQHPGSWFTIERCKQGEWKNKGYYIRTHGVNKVLDVAGGDYKDDPFIKQCSAHDAHNQMWLIVPADDKLPEKHQPQQHQRPQQQQQQQGGHQVNVGGFKFNVPNAGELLKGFSGWGKSNEGGGNQGFGGGNQGFGGGNQGFSGGNQGFGGGNQGFGGGNQGFGGGNQGFGGGNQGFGGPFKPNQTYAFLSEGNQQKCMHVIDNGMKMGNVAIYDWRGTMNQKFVLEAEGPNRYRIRSAANGNYINVTHDTENDSMWIRTDPRGNLKSEIWTIELKSGNTYFVKSYFGKGIDVPANDYQNEKILVQWSFHGGANQSWIIREA